MKIKIVNNLPTNTFSILNEDSEKISENHNMVQPDMDYWDYAFAAREYLKVLPKNVSSIEIEDEGIYSIQELRKISQG